MDEDVLVLKETTSSVASYLRMKVYSELEKHYAGITAYQGEKITHKKNA